MRTFGELKEYMVNKLLEKSTHSNMGRLHFQIYESKILQFNAFFGADEPDIKFEERTEGVFTVAVLPVGGDAIQYAFSKDFKMDDNIVDLVIVFPTGNHIDDIIACILSYKSEG